MTTRRRFTSEFKARVALEALRGDRTVQEIASHHKVHPNQVSTWKRQAVEGLSAVFSDGADYERQDRESEVRDLHAKIGRLTVERDFLAKGVLVVTALALEALHGVKTGIRFERLTPLARRRCHSRPNGKWLDGRTPRCRRSNGPLAGPDLRTAGSVKAGENHCSGNDRGS